MRTNSSQIAHFLLVIIPVEKSPKLFGGKMKMSFDGKMYDQPKKFSEDDTDQFHSRQISTGEPNGR